MGRGDEEREENEEREEDEEREECKEHEECGAHSEHVGDRLVGARKMQLQSAENEKKEACGSGTKKAVDTEKKGSTEKVAKKGRKAERTPPGKGGAVARMRRIFGFRQQDCESGEEEVDVTARLSAGSRNAELHDSRSYPSYLLQMFRNGTPYALYRRARGIFGPAFFIGRVARIAIRIFAILQTSATLLLAGAFLLLLLPAVALLTLAYAYAAARDRRRCNRRYAALIADRRVLIFFPSLYHNFCDRQAGELSQKYTVLLVTDAPQEYLAGKKMPLSCAARQRADGVLVVREHYYFHLRKTLLLRAAFCAQIY